MSKQMNAADFEYASNFRSTCYECSKTEHNMRNYTDIDMLINQEIVHWDDSDHFVWDKEDTHNISV